MKSKSKKPAISASLDTAAATIAANMQRQTDPDAWDQDRIAALKLNDGKVGALPLRIIRTNQNVRQRIDTDAPAFTELVEAVRRHGILQPPVVSVVETDGMHQVVLVAGERRLLAAKTLGMTTINCLVRQFSTEILRRTAALSENLNRLDLHPFDIADCYRELSDKGLKHADITKIYGRDRKATERLIKMSHWPTEVKDLIRAHPDRFPLRKLMALASRRMEPQQLTEAINSVVNEDEPERKDAQPSQPAQPLDRFMAYCESRGLSKKDREVLMRALTDLGVLRQIRFDPKEKPTAQPT